MSTTDVIEALVARRAGGGSVIRALARDGALMLQRIDACRGAHMTIEGRDVVSFTSTDYLGLGREQSVIDATARAIAEWGCSLPIARAVGDHPLVRDLETRIARLVGQEAALVFPSTAHVADDVLPLLAGSGVVLADSWLYPIHAGGVHAAASRGAAVVTVPHGDRRSLASHLRGYESVSDKVVACDGPGPYDGSVDRVRDVVEVAAEHGAMVFVDDAHAIGVLGAPAPDAEGDSGGGGSLLAAGVAGGPVVHVASLSKSFGVPLAFAAADARLIDLLRITGPTMFHASQPAIPVIAAAAAVLAIHDDEGEARRRRLHDNATRFGEKMGEIGVRMDVGAFHPIQSVYFRTPEAAARMAFALRGWGVWAALQVAPPERPLGAALRFVITARHTLAEVESAVDRVAEALAETVTRDKLASNHRQKPGTHGQRTIG